MINSLENDKVKYWNKLKMKKYRDMEDLFLIEGDHLLQDALNKKLVKEIISSNEIYKEDNIPFYLVSDNVLKKLSNQDSGTNVIAVCYKLKTKEIEGNVCLLDNIQDPGNLGTIIRSCVAFNIDTLVCSLDTVDIYNEKVIRASEGNIFNLNVIKTDLEEILKELKKKNYYIYSTDVSIGTKINKVLPKSNYAIIMGNEGQGVKENIKKLADEFLNIPLKSTVESLNVAVATSIILYDFYMKEGL